MNKSMVGIILMVLFIHHTGNAQQKISTQALSPQQESIVPIAAFTANGDQINLKIALNDGLNAGLSINEIKEILVQMYAYTGFPRSLNAINSLETVVNERLQKGIIDSLGKTSSYQPFNEGKFAFGKNVQTILTGTTAIGAPQKYVPVIDTFLKEHLFADIFSRDILDFQQREIATISALASLSGAENQLRSHLKVGKNIGMSEAQLRGIATIISTKVGWKEGNVVMLFLDEMFGVTSPKNLEPPTHANALDDGLIFPKGEKINNKNFTGTVWLQQLVLSDSLNANQVGSVTFEPGARTNWHYHPDGQILLVISGVGYYQEKGRPKKILNKGDVVKCPPNLPHWHGASPNHEFIQVAITNIQKGTVVWLDPVSDEEYHQ
ncbi:MAG: carboxymuconolactone decarboxylase family protein [Saprospiraceae bacterium]|nr:carboxymuconolactone decarboxylase family protein [Saprospiraceae bacterium]